MKMLFMSAIIAEAELSFSGSCAELMSCPAVPQFGLLLASAVQDHDDVVMSKFLPGTTNSWYQIEFIKTES